MLYRIFTAVALVLMLGACASTHAPNSAAVAETPANGTHGLVVGRTNPDKRGRTGSKIVFRNVETGAYFSTGEGSSGYTEFDTFALWLPNGRYTLHAIFAHNGNVGPTTRLPEIQVTAGQISYIGTLAVRWGIVAPSGLKHLAIYKFGRLTCGSFMELGCNGPNPTFSDNGRAGRPIVSVFVTDGDGDFEQHLRKAYPTLPDWFVTRALLMPERHR